MKITMRCFKRKWMGSIFQEFKRKKLKYYNFLKSLKMCALWELYICSHHIYSHVRVLGITVLQQWSSKITLHRKKFFHTKILHIHFHYKFLTVTRFKKEKRGKEKLTFLWHMPQVLLIEYKAEVLSVCSYIKNSQSEDKITRRKLEEEFGIV